MPEKTNDLLIDHYNQVQTLISMIHDKGLDCLSVRTEYDNDRANTVIDMSVENFAIFTEGKEVCIRPHMILYTVIHEHNLKQTRLNNISLVCYIDDDQQSIKTIMDRGIVSAILENTNFSFDSEFFTRGDNA